MHLIRDLDCDLIVEPRRRAETRSSIVSPEDSDEAFFRCAHSRRVNPVASKRFRFVKSGGVFGAVHGWRRRRAKLAAGLNDEWRAFTPVRAQGNRKQTDGVLSPMSREITRKIAHSNARLWNLHAVVCMQCKDGRGGGLA